MKKLYVHLPGTDKQLSVENEGSSNSLSIDRELSLNCSGYLYAWCFGSNQEVLASPVYIEVPGGRTPDFIQAAKSECAAKLLEDLEDRLSWVNIRARFESDQQRDRLAGIFLAAKDELARRAGSRN